MTIRDLTPTDVDGLAAFFGALSEEDVTFIREDVHDRASAATKVAACPRLAHGNVRL